MKPKNSKRKNRGFNEKSEVFLLEFDLNGQEKEKTIEEYPLSSSIINHQKEQTSSPNQQEYKTRPISMENPPESDRSFFGPETERQLKPPENFIFQFKIENNEKVKVANYYDENMKKEVVLKLPKRKFKINSTELEIIHKLRDCEGVARVEMLDDFIYLVESGEASLWDIIKIRRKTNKNYTEPEIFHILNQIIIGLIKFHELKIAHCDIKPMNVILVKNDGGFKYKIIDFETATRNIIKGFTKSYAAPELLRKEKKVHLKKKCRTNYNKIKKIKKTPKKRPHHLPAFEIHDVLPLDMFSKCHTRTNYKKIKKIKKTPKKRPHHLPAFEIHDVLPLDMFSLGVTLLEMTGRRPKNNNDIQNLKAEYPLLVEIITELTYYNHKKRLTIDDLRQKMCDIRIRFQVPNENDLVTIAKGEIKVKQNILIQESKKPIKDYKKYYMKVLEYRRHIFNNFLFSQSFSFELIISALSPWIRGEKNLMKVIIHCLYGSFLVEGGEFIQAEDHFTQAINIYSEKGSTLNKNQFIILLYFFQILIFKITNSNSLEETLKMYKRRLEEEKPEMKLLRKFCSKNSIKYTANGLFEFDLEKFKVNITNPFSGEVWFQKDVELINFLLENYKNPEKLSKEKILEIFGKIPEFFALFLYFQNYWNAKGEYKKIQIIFIEGLIYYEQKNWEKAFYAFEFGLNLETKKGILVPRELSFLAGLYLAEILQNHNFHTLIDIGKLYYKCFQLGLFFLKKTTEISDYIQVILTRIEEWESAIKGKDDKFAEEGKDKDALESLSDIKDFILIFNEKNIKNLDFKDLKKFMEGKDGKLTEIGKKLKKTLLFEIYFDFSLMANFWLSKNKRTLFFKCISTQMKFKRIINNENSFIFLLLSHLNNKLLDIIPINKIQVFISLGKILYHQENHPQNESKIYQDIIQISNNPNEKYRNFLLKIILLHLKKGEKKAEKQLLSEIQEFHMKNELLVEDILEFRPIEQYTNESFLNSFGSICDFSQKTMLFEEFFNYCNHDIIAESFKFLANWLNKEKIRQDWKLIAKNGSKSCFQLFFYFLVYGPEFDYHHNFCLLIEAENYYKNCDYASAVKKFQKIMEKTGENNNNWVSYFIMLRLSLIYKSLNFNEKSNEFLEKSLKILEILKKEGVFFEKSLIDFPAFLSQTKLDFMNKLYSTQGKQPIKNFKLEEETIKFYKVLRKIEERNLECSNIEINDFLEQNSKNTNLAEIHFREALKNF